MIAYQSAVEALVDSAVAALMLLRHENVFDVVGVGLVLRHCFDWIVFWRNLHVVEIRVGVSC
jgi:hypothetical protein